MSALPIWPIPQACRLPLAALVLGAWCAAGAQAQALAVAPDLTALPLEQLLSMEVSSASKFVQKSNQAPALVTVISAADIRRYGWRTLAEVARSVRGMTVSYDRNYSYLGTRGFLRPGDYNTRFLLLVDGNRINDGVYDQAPLGGEFPLELELIERIEFVPGPGSSIYGSNAFFGVINVITKKGADLAGPRITFEAGSAGARKASLSSSFSPARGPAQGMQMLFAASAHRSDGRDLYFPEFDSAAQNNGVAAGRDYERGQRVMGSVSAGPFSLTLIHARRVKGVPTASFAQPFNDPRSATTDRQSYLNAAFQLPVRGPEQMGARLSLGAYDSTGTYVIDDAGRTLNHDGSKARWWGAELSLVSTRFAGHTLLAGLDYQRDVRLRQFSHDLAPYFSYLDDSRSGTRAGLYLQDEVALSGATLLNLGLRHDRNTVVGGVTSPRIALIHQAGTDTTFKLIYGSAFRAPNAYERFYTFPGEGGQLPNAGLAPETIRSSELALVHQLGARTRLTVSVFSNLVLDLIGLVQDGAAPETRFENGARVRARGVELEYERRWQNGAALRTSYSTSRTGDGQEINAPRSLAKMNLAAPLGALGWRAALEAHYVGARGTAQHRAPSFWLVNANLLHARLFNHVEASLGIYNLLDKRYADPGSVEHRQGVIEQDGRTLRARVAYGF